MLALYLVHKWDLEKPAFLTIIKTDYNKAFDYRWKISLYFIEQKCCKIVLFKSLRNCKKVTKEIYVEI